MSDYFNLFCCTNGLAGCMRQCFFLSRTAVLLLRMRQLTSFFFYSLTGSLGLVVGVPITFVMLILLAVFALFM